jgi:membrane protease YdiL (CAAX protease family)
LRLREGVVRIVKTIVWNATEHRLRAGWRLLIQLLLFFALLAAGVRILNGVGRGTVAGAVLAGSFYLAAGLGVAWLLARFIDRRPFAGYGFHLGRGWWLDFGFGLLLGTLMVTGIFLVEYLAGWITVRASPDSSSLLVLAEVLLASLLVYVAVGINEEFTFRGYQLRNLAEGLAGQWIGPTLAVVLALCISATAFGLSHLGNRNASVVSTANIVLGGLAFGLPFVLTGELAMPLGLHIAWNFCEGTVYGFAVSGHAPIRPILAVEQGGPELWTGGAFGPEAGLLAVVAIVLGCAGGVLWISWRCKRLAVHVQLAVYQPRLVPTTSLPRAVGLGVPASPTSAAGPL